MTVVGNLAVFALGVYLSIRMVAALYQILDLWYRIGTDYPRVLRGVLGWAATIAAVSWLLNATARVSLAAGLMAYLLFYLSLFGLRHVVIAWLRDATEGDSVQNKVAGPVQRRTYGSSQT